MKNWGACTVLFSLVGGAANIVAIVLGALACDAKSPFEEENKAACISLLVLSCTGTIAATFTIVGLIIDTWVAWPTIRVFIMSVGGHPDHGAETDV